MSDSSQWFDHQIPDLSPAQRAVLEQSLRSEGIPATFGPAAVRTDIAYEARVATLIDHARTTAAGAASPPAYPNPAASPYAATPYAASGYPVAPPTNSNAIVALVLGIASLLVCSLAGPVAIIVGQRARREISRTGEQGDGLALAGVITGAIATALLAIIAVALIVVVVVAAASST